MFTRLRHTAYLLYGIEVPSGQKHKRDSAAYSSRCESVSWSSDGEVHATLAVCVQLRESCKEGRNASKNSSSRLPKPRRVASCETTDDMESALVRSQTV
jgi:hypothetical protein